jgi:hypothetical protein
MNSKYLFKRSGVQAGEDKIETAAKFAPKFECSTKSKAVLIKLEAGMRRAAD